jgi:hypothetical protein
MDVISFLELELSFLKISEYLAEKLLSCGLRKRDTKVAKCSGPEQAH